MDQSAGTSLANTSVQNCYMGMFATGTFDVGQTVGGGGQTMTLNIANSESNLAMNLGANLQCNVYVWRPSTGTKVGTVCANLAMTGDAEPGAANSVRVNNCTTASTTQVTAAAGDILVCEIWQVHTQGTAAAYSGSFYMDGGTENTTTNAVVTDHASYLGFSADTLTFGTPVSSISAAFSTTLASVGLSASGGVGISGSREVTLANATVSASGGVAVRASLTATLAALGVTGTGKVVTHGSFAATLADASVTGTGLVTALPAISGSFSSTLGAVSVDATGVVSDPQTQTQPLEGGFGVVGMPAQAKAPRRVKLQKIINLDEPHGKGLDDIFGIDSPGETAEDVKPPKPQAPTRSVLAEAISAGNSNPAELPGSSTIAPDGEELDDVDLMLILALIA